MNQFTKDGHCKEMLERFSQYIDGELDGACCQELEKHLASCPECVDSVEGMRAIVAICRKEQEQGNSLRPNQAFRARLRSVVSSLPPDES